MGLSSATSIFSRAAFRHLNFCVEFRSSAISGESMAEHGCSEQNKDVFRAYDEYEETKYEDNDD